eukprot:625506_1
MYCLICFRGYDSSPLFGCSVRCSLLEQNQQIEIVDGALSIRVLSSCIWIASRHHSSLHICFDDFVYFMSVPCDVFGNLSLLILSGCIMYMNLIWISIHVHMHLCF